MEYFIDIQQSMHIRPRFPKHPQDSTQKCVDPERPPASQGVFFSPRRVQDSQETPPSNGATSLSTSEPWPWSTVHLSHRSIWFNNLVLDNHELIGGFNPSEKYESQSGWMIPNIWKIKFMFQITNQRIFSFSSISLLYVPRGPLPSRKVTTFHRDKTLRSEGDFPDESSTNGFTRPGNKAIENGHGNSGFSHE